MATVITSECINCGACEPECPNTAIYQGGVEWQAPDAAMHPAISNDIFYIVPETPDVLLTRARALHPDKTIPDDAPSRFAKEGGEAKAPGEAKPAAPPVAA